MGHVADDSIAPDAATSDICRNCGQPNDPAWRFCVYCGTSGEVDETPSGSPASPQPRRLGNLSYQAPTSITEEDMEGVHPIPGYDPARAQAARRRRKRRRRRPWYRRKAVLAPTIVLICLAIVLAGTLYRANSIMSTLQSLSTPPAEITDSTYIQGDDPDMPGGPITVQTGPAQQALAEAGDGRSLPAPAEGGFGDRLRDLTSGVGDVAGGAAIASGLRDGSAEGFTVLVMGVDAQPGSPIDIGVRPDVLMLIRFDPASSSCRMLSIPRDTRVELPGYGESKINHALMVGGIPYQLMVTEDFIGQPIDHYVLVDFVAFKKAVDVLGGVTVKVPEDLKEDGKTVYTAGTHQFNGDEALAFSRHRAVPDGDAGRVRRQWSVLSGLAEAAQGRDLVTDVNRLVPTVEEHVRTDLTMTEMATIADTYGDECLAIDKKSIDMIKGTRVKFHDPILDQVVYFNDVSESTVKKRVEELLAGDTEGTVQLGASHLSGTLANGRHDALGPPPHGKGYRPPDFW